MRGPVGGLMWQEDNYMLFLLIKIFHEKSNDKIYLFMEVCMRGEEFVNGLKIQLISWQNRLNIEHSAKDKPIKCEQCSNMSVNGLCLSCVNNQISIAESQLSNAKLHYDH